MRSMELAWMMGWGDVVWMCEELDVDLAVVAKREGVRWWWC